LRRFTWTTLLLLIIASLLLGACKPTTEEPGAPQEPAVPKTVTITFFEEPDTLNQLYSGMWFSQILTESYLRGLWNFDNQLEMVPKMAAEIPTTENGGDLAD
jgi:peptide/nickel transport system substrate-binding protein